MTKAAAAKKNPLTMHRPSAVTPLSARAAAVAEGEARLNVGIPASLHAALKAHVANERTTIRDFVIALLHAKGIGR
jgi:hypothetical protein